MYVYRKTTSSWVQEAYIKASNAEVGDLFGGMVKLSADGSRLAVAADNEDSAATGVNGNQSNNTGASSGAVYIFRRNGTTWVQEAYIKASNTGAVDHFGNAALDLSDDGSVLAVGANGEDSNATGINGNQFNNSADAAGAVYIFSRSGTTWTQQAYIKASNTGAEDQFGRPIALSGDGNRLAVAAVSEDSNATGINGNQFNNSMSGSGAIYIFTKTGSTWAQEAYVKASNTGIQDQFGSALSLNEDGTILAASSPLDDSSATGINGTQTGGGNSDNYGSVFIFRRTGGNWGQEAYIKPTAVGNNDLFGFKLSINNDGSRLAVGVFSEDSNAVGIGGNENDNSASAAGAVYVFGRENNSWYQEFYVKASNTDAGDSFGGASLSLSSGCKLYLAVSTIAEASNVTGINGNQNNNSAPAAGAVYIIE